jgi:hypothetical protein
MEFGMDGDIDGVSPVDRQLVSAGEAVALQEWFASDAATAASVYWQTDAEAGYRRTIRRGDNDQAVGFTGQGLSNDLWALAGRMRGDRLPADYQRHLEIVDFTTVARDNDSPDINRICEPFAASGFWVAPLMKGFGGVCMSFRRRRR